MKMLHVESVRQFRRVYSRVCGSQYEQVNIERLYDVFCCAGITPTNLEELWPEGMKTINFEEAFDLFERCDITDVFHGPFKFAGVEMPTALVVRHLQESSLGSAEHDYLERMLMEYNTDGGFNVEKFSGDVAATRNSLLRRLLSGDSLEEPLTPRDSTPKQEEEKERLTHRKETNEAITINRRGFLLIAKELRSIDYRFRITREQTIDIQLAINKNTDMEDNAFKDDVFGVLFDVNADQIVAVTKMRNGETYSTGLTLLQPGDYSLSIMCSGVTVTPSNQGRGKELLLDDNKKLTKRFKMTLMNIFEMFDINGDGLLDRKEFDSFNTATGDEPMTSEDWEILSEHFSLRDGCVPMNAFLHMHQIEADSCKEGEGDITDMWTSLHLIGYDEGLKMKLACPYTVTFIFQEDVQITDELRVSSREERQLLTSYFYDQGVPIDGVLSVRLYKADYFGVLVAEEMPNSPATDSYALEIKVSEGVRTKAAVVLKDFKPHKYKDRVNLIFFISSKPMWDVEISAKKN